MFKSTVLQNKKDRYIEKELGGQGMRQEEGDGKAECITYTQEIIKQVQPIKKIFFHFQVKRQVSSCLCDWLRRVRIGGKKRFYSKDEKTR